MLVNDNNVIYISFNKSGKIEKITNDITKINKKSKNLLIKKIKYEESILFRTIKREDLISFLASEATNTTLNHMDFEDCSDDYFEITSDNMLLNFIDYYEQYDYYELLEKFLYDNFKKDIEVSLLNQQVLKLVGKE